MISEGEKEEIRALLRLGRKRPLNFGICMGEEPIETVFIIHRRNPPEACVREAKEEGTTHKTCKGQLGVQGTTIILDVDGRVPSGLTRNLKKYLKIMKLKFGIELGPLPEFEPEDETDEAQEGAPQAQVQPAEEAQQEAAPAAPDVPPDQAKFESKAAELTPQIEALQASDDPRARKIIAIWDLAEKRAGNGDFRTALKAVSSIEALV